MNKKSMYKRLQAWMLVGVMLVVGLCTFRAEPVKAAKKMGITYTTHMQTFGDSKGWVSDGKTSGYAGKGKYMDAVRIKLTGDAYEGGVRYKVLMKDYGWKDWSKDGATSGNRGKKKQIEGIEIELTGEVADYYEVAYRIYSQGKGWLAWTKNGKYTGVTGKRVEALQVKLVPKNKITNMGITYRTKTKSAGWKSWNKNGTANGSIGKNMEYMQIKLLGNKLSGGVDYRTYVKGSGWEKKKVSNAAVSGKKGNGKVIQAVQISLYGDVAIFYDVYYRTYVKGSGWLGWAKNGAKSGTTKTSGSMQAIEIKLVKHGSDVSQYEGGKSGFETGTSSEASTGEEGGNPSSTGDATAKQKEVLNLCNAFRAENGVSVTLSMDDKLTQAANIRAKEIAEKFDHMRPNGTTCFTVLDDVGYAYMCSGENIAAGQPSADKVMTAWENSQGHRQNILNSKYKKIGIGYYEDPTKPYRYYWVQIFAD